MSQTLRLAEPVLVGSYRNVYLEHLLRLLFLPGATPVDVCRLHDTPHGILAEANQTTSSLGMQVRTLILFHFSLFRLPLRPIISRKLLTLNTLMFAGFRIGSESRLGPVVLFPPSSTTSRRSTSSLWARVSKTSAGD